MEAQTQEVNSQTTLVGAARWTSDEQLGLTTDQWSEENTKARVDEESAQKALLLRKKELRWKLMQANEGKNWSKLEEIRTEVNYHKQKLSKAKNLAARLRLKYLKVIKSARIVEAQFEKAQAQLLLQEKFVAEEKMMSTKLAIDCLNLGKAIYGSDYQLPNSNSSNISERNQTTSQQSNDFRFVTNKQNTSSDINLRDKLLPFIRNARSNEVLPITAASNSQTLVYSTKRRKKSHVTRLSSLIDLRDSTLLNLGSFRLTRKFTELNLSLTDLKYSHNISPHKYVCLPDLIGECTDKNCPHQHKSNYLMTDLEKLTDILSYKPSIAGFRSDPDLSDGENYKICRIKLKQKAAQLISKNPDKSVEVIAQDLVRKIRGENSDSDLLVMIRELPKVSHLATRNIENKCSCQTIFEDQNNTLETRIKLEIPDANDDIFMDIEHPDQIATKIKIEP